MREYWVNVYCVANRTMYGSAWTDRYQTIAFKPSYRIHVIMKDKKDDTKS